ncbi:MAG: efflux RND transporter periplasmic adaptor subunit [Victivallales bacterium]|nr:efflux RND transporter periplasmic adaptor subunit [Victivallales bacterium]
MKKIRVLLTFAAVIAIIAAAVHIMSAVSARRSESQKAAAGSGKRAVTVRTGKVGRADIINVLTFNGDIEAMHSVELQPRVAGRLVTLALEDGTPVDEGVQVKAGQQIAKIDDREYKAELANAKAAMASASARQAASRAELEQKKASLLSSVAATASAQANFDDKQRELTRQTRLVEGNAATKQSLDLAETAFAQAKASLEQHRANEKAAEAQVRSAEAQIIQADADYQQAEAKLESAQISFDETVIRAPMDGVISKRHVDPGAVLATSTTIVSIIAVDTVKAIISVPVNHIAGIIPGKTHATLRTSALPGEGIDCVVGKIYPAVNTATRTAQVEFRVANIFSKQSGYALRPGMYATLDMVLENRENVVAIDVSLPIRNLEKELIYVCEGDTVRAVPVKLGVRLGNMVEVLEGLEEGQEIVVQGQHRLTDGATIKRVAE